MKKRLLTICVILIALITAHAQQFDWVHGGGSGDALSAPYENEATYFMCTDPNGNIYAVSEVGSSAITADTFHVNGAYNIQQNFLITSYTCNGQMRWAKLVASNSDECVPNGIVADSLGHIYVAGYVTNNTLHIGNDVTVTGQTHQHLAIIQFDTLGHYNWMQYVGDNTQPLGLVGMINCLKMDANNNAHFICYVESGLTVAPGVTTHYGDYDLVYSPSGSLLSATRLDIDSSWYVESAAIDLVTNKLYVTGERNMYLPGGDPNQRHFIASFDANRNRIWMDTLGNPYSIISGMAYDKMGHLYFAGSSAEASFTYRNLIAPNGNVSIVLKIDTSGSPIWLQSNTINANGTNGNIALTLLPNNLVVVTGIFGTTLTDGIHTITCPQAGNNPFLSILDTSGVPMSLYQIYGDGFYDWSRSITSDKVGNVYIGGQVEDSIFEPNIPAYHTYGGNTDFFIMKYGMDCDCTSMPVANFSNVISQFTSDFTYNGTMANIDSVTWNFGDGTTGNGNTPSHTYPTVPQGQSMFYEVCVTAYTHCGNDMHCSQLRIDGPVSVNNVTNEDDVQVYPNPAKDELKIVTKTYDSYKLLSLTGATIENGTILNNATVSIKNIASGIYLLELKSASGETKRVKIVKE